MDIISWCQDIDLNNADIKVLYSDDIHAANTFEDMEKVVPCSADIVSAEGKVLLKKHSLTVIIASLKTQ